VIAEANDYYCLLISAVPFEQHCKENEACKWQAKFKYLLTLINACKRLQMDKGNENQVVE
jgi:hypothetical protein